MPTVLGPAPRFVAAFGLGFALGLVVEAVQLGQVFAALRHVGGNLVLNLGDLLRPFLPHVLDRALELTPFIELLRDQAVLLTPIAVPSFEGFKLILMPDRAIFSGDPAPDAREAARQPCKAFLLFSLPPLRMRPQTARM